MTCSGPSTRRSSARKSYERLTPASVRRKSGVLETGADAPEPERLDGERGHEGEHGEGQQRKRVCVLQQQHGGDDCEHGADPLPGEPPDDAVAGEHEAEEEEREAQCERGPSALGQGLAGRTQRLLRGDREEDDPEHDRVVEEGVHVAREPGALLLARTVHRSVDGELCEVEVGPPRGRSAGERDRDRECEQRIAVELHRGEPDRDDRLAEGDDHDQRVPLGEVRGENAEARAPGELCSQDVDRERRRPERRSPGVVHEASGERDGRRDEEPGGEPHDAEALHGVVANAPEVETDLQDADDEVRDGEPRALVRIGVGQRDSDEERRHHRPEEEEPGRDVLDVDRIGQPRVCRPSPPDEAEDERRPREPGGRRVLEHQRADLCEREDEDEVEEQLDVAGALLLLGVRRLDAFLGDAHGAQNSSNASGSLGSASTSWTMPSSILNRRTCSSSSVLPRLVPRAVYSAAARSSLASTSRSDEPYVPSVSLGKRARNRKISSRPRWTPAITPRPGTVQVASVAKRPRSAKPSFRENASKMLLTSASLPAFDTRFLPAGDEPVDVTALRFRERELCDEPARLRRVVVLDGRLQVLSERRRLPELPAKPAAQADRGLVDHACTLSLPGAARAGRSLTRRVRLRCRLRCRRT